MAHRRRRQTNRKRQTRCRRTTRRQYGGNHDTFIRNLQIFSELEDRLREGNDADRRAVFIEMINSLIKTDQFTKSIYLSNRIKMKIAQVLVKEFPNLPEQTRNEIQTLKQHFGV